MSEITAGTLRAALVIAEAEIERLREENSCLISQRVEAEAEIERLTAALRDAEILIPNDLVGPWALAHRAALEGK